MKKIFFAAAAMLMLFSCKEKEMPVTPEEKPDAIEITPESRTFGEEGGSVDVIVTSTGEWTLSAAENYDWVEVSATEGVDGDIVKFTVAENFDADKKGDFEFVCGEAKAAFTVFSYAGKLPHIYLDSDADLTFDYKEHTSVEILVSSDETNYRDLEIEVSEGAEEWLVYRAALPGDTELSARIYFDVTALEGLDDRDAVVTISAPGVNDVLTVNVLQLAKHVLYTDKEFYTIAVEGETIYVPLYVNVAYDVKVEQEGNWLTVGEMTEEGLPVTAAALTDGKRSATITFTQTDAAEGEEVLYATITITQVHALITWAADMTGNRLFPKWENGGPGAATQFTLESLIYVNEFPANQLIATVMGIEGQFLLRFGDTGNPLTRLQVATSAGNYNVPFDFSPNTWYHVALTFDNATVKVYVDGEQKGEDKYFESSRYVWGQGYIYSPINPDISPAWSYEPDGNRAFWMGYSYDQNRSLPGLMTEIRIWNKALTAEEINAPNHFYTVDPNSEGLFSYWKFVEGQGSTVADATGKGNPLYGEVDITKQSNGDNCGPEGIEWVEVALPDR